MDDKQWFFSDEWEESDLDIKTSIPPIANGDSAAPLALPVTIGDRITIHYPEDLDADVRVRDNPEVWHFGGITQDSIKLLSEDAHEQLMGDLIYNPRRSSGRVVEGVYRFNERVLKHAEKIEVERIEVSLPE